MKYKIGWQKFESTLEDQLSSPILQILMEKVADYTEYEENFDEEEYVDQPQKRENVPLLPISEKLLEDISLLSNFECWIGHTNFDITRDIKDTLDKTQGIEILKILSRYRFFIGVGKMFDFKNVRKNVENNIIPKEQINE